LPDGSWQIAAALRQLPAGPARPVLLVGDVQLASRLRVVLGKQWVIAQANNLTPVMTLNYTRFLLKEPDARATAALGWQVQRIASYPTRTPPSKELFQALKTRTLRAVVCRNGDQIYLNVRE
jgi:hypothetical protein